ncbi:hypothetical protein ACJIZ3_025683 [Penstemon smallii]|uniref:RRM domain-containing protein n=1 Tax=Penstemon smallii TaxID=265156 RepID=A0ABD3TWA7_9LAMI
MAKKRKANFSRQPHQQKAKIIPKEEDEKEEEEEKETSDEEEEKSEPESKSESESESESKSEEDEEDEEEEDDESSSSEEEANDEATKRVSLREMLEPFEKSQIIDLLKEAAKKDPTLLASIVHVADSDPIHRKIFIHGLGWDATSDQLLEAFKPFGEIDDLKLVTDKITGRAKGYAFVIFKTRASAKKALKIPQKKIGSRTVSCQLAALGPPTAAGTPDVGNRKMYVGNVGPHVNPEKLREFFARFGEIEEGPFGLDPATNKFRGFAVITYKSTEGFKKAMEEPMKVFDNCQLHCKKFVENQNKNNGVVSTAVTNVSYGSLGVNPGIMGSNLNAGGLMMAQNPGIGLAGNPMLAAGYNPAGFVASGLSMPIAGMGGNYGISPGVMGNYGSQAALQGLGAYQNVQMGQASLGTAATATTTSRAPASDVSDSLLAYFAR